MSEAKHTPVQFGMTVGADFEASTMTLEMEPGYVVAVGPVAVLPRGTYDELLEAAQDLTKWVAAFAYGEGQAAHSVVMESPRMKKALAAIAKANGEQA